MNEEKGKKKKSSLNSTVVFIISVLVIVLLLKVTDAVFTNVKDLFVNNATYVHYSYNARTHENKDFIGEGLFECDGPVNMDDLDTLRDLIKEDNTIKDVIFTHWREIAE